MHSSFLEKDFNRFQISKPQARRARNLSDFPLDVPSIQPDEDTETDTFAALDQSSARGQRVERLVKLVWHRITSKYNADAQARIKRKNLEVIERVKIVEDHRYDLVEVIRSSPAVKQSPESKLLQRLTKDDIEGCIHSCRCILDKRPGRLYISFSHLAFYSNILSFEFSRIVPLVSLKSVKKCHGVLGLGNGIMVLLDNAATDLQSIFYFAEDCDGVFTLIEQLRDMQEGSLKDQSQQTSLLSKRLLQAALISCPNKGQLSDCSSQFDQLDTYSSCSKS